VVSYLGLIGVGICSAGYHMTLKYHTQMCKYTETSPTIYLLSSRWFLQTHHRGFPADELSMHLLTTPVLYRILTFQSTPERTRLVGVILSILFTVVMVTHMVMDEFLLHASTFGLVVYLIATRTLKLILEQVPDDHIRKNLRNVALFGWCMCSKSPQTPPPLLIM
jgi:dihydroceramidase